MDYRTYYAAYHLEKREEFSKIQIKDWGLLIGSGFFSTSFSFMVWIFKAYNSCEFDDYFSASTNRIFSWRFFLFKERTTYSAIATMAIAILGVVCIGWGDLGLSEQAIYGDILSF